MTEQALERTGTAAMMGFEGAQVTTTSLVLDDSVTVDRALEIAGVVGKVARAGGWWVGDLIIQSEARFDESVAAQIAHATGWGEDTVLGWTKMCRTIRPEHRSEIVSVSTHVDMLRLYTADPEHSGYMNLMRHLEDHYQRTGRNLGHKDVRKILPEYGGQVELEDMPMTTQEENAMLRLTLAETQTALIDARLAAGTHVRCPKCQQVHRAEDARVGPRQESIVQ